MFWLIVIVALIVVGALYLMRSEAPAPLSTGAADEEAAARFRGLMLERLRERVVGWRWSEIPGEPLRLSGDDGGSGQQHVLDLTEAFQRWRRAPTEQIGQAVLDDFIRGATGAEEGTIGEVDLEWVRNALALQLMKPDAVPAQALSRPAGPLVAVLVLEQPGGAAPALAEDLESWQLGEEEAFELALSNLSEGFAESANLDVIAGTEEAPDAIEVMPADPLAASYALIPGVRDELAKRLGADFRWFIDSERTLTGARAGVTVEQDEKRALVTGAIDPAVFFPGE